MYELINRQSTFEANTHKRQYAESETPKLQFPSIARRGNVTSHVTRPKKRTINKRCSGYRSRAMTSSLHSLREKNHRCVRNAVNETKTVYPRAIYMFENRIVIVSSVRLLSTHENFVARPIPLFDQSKRLISFLFFVP